MTTTNPKITGIRNFMFDNRIDALVIPLTDPHLSEYVPEHYKAIKWLTGFTGSAATVILTQNVAKLWTDSRYFIQAENQLKNSGFELEKLKIPHTPEYIDWLVDNLFQGNTVAVNGECNAARTIKYLRKRLNSKDIELITKINCIDNLWIDRPELPTGLIFEHPIQFAGISRSDKINAIKKQMQSKGCTHHLIATLDDIAWILNLRGNDIKYSPLFIAYLLIAEDYITLYININKIPEHLQKTLISQQIGIKPYGQLSGDLKLLEINCVVLLDEATVNYKLYAAIPSVCTIVSDSNISTMLKAQKTEHEIANFKKTMIYDGIALEKFFFWLEQNSGKISLTELSVAEKLTELRKMQPGYFSNSFESIAAYRENGALPHYAAEPETTKKLEPPGLFLIDSGGQYITGTTDITRVVAFGAPTPDQINDFTLVLKGMIQLSKTTFPKGTRGFQLDAIARKPLWEQLKNFGHGVGHGVGYFLNVHEGPQAISSSGNGASAVALLPGMIISNEPGYYKQNHYGIRIENLILVTTTEGNQPNDFYCFETLSLCHIEKNLINKSMLTKKEIDWLNGYHKKVYQLLSEHLSPEEKSWLKNKTEDI